MKTLSPTGFFYLEIALAITFLASCTLDEITDEATPSIACFSQSRTSCAVGNCEVEFDGLLFAKCSELPLGLWGWSISFRRHDYPYLYDFLGHTQYGSLLQILLGCLIVR